MRPLAILCCLLCSASLAAPVPKSKGEFQRPEWGKPIDPDGKSKFTFTESGVTIEAPAGHRDLWPSSPTKRISRPMTNAPRLMRAAKGDFDVEVRVTGAPNVAVGDWVGGVSAGLVVTDKEGKLAVYRVAWGMHNLIKGGPRLFAYAQMGANERHVTSSRYETADPTVKAAAANGRLKKGLFVKIERRGANLKGYYSADGKKYVLILRGGAEDEDAIEGEVKVGVALFTRSSEPNKVTFDRFKLTPRGSK